MNNPKTIRILTLSESKLKRSAEHVYYEIWMFISTIHELTKNTQNQFQINILLESFGIHLRNLLYFFYTHPKNRVSDDMLAEDFISNLKLYKKNRTPKHKLTFTIKRTHKQLVHLTYHRNRYNRKTKPWKFGEIYQLLFPTVAAFYEALPRKRKKWQQPT